jgi:hypothetical protein
VVNSGGSIDGRLRDSGKHRQEYEWSVRVQSRIREIIKALARVRVVVAIICSYKGGSLFWPASIDVKGYETVGSIDKSTEER